MEKQVMTKKVPYTVCKAVETQKTIKVARCVPCQVPVTVTRCVPKVVCEQVPVQVHCCTPRLFRRRAADASCGC
jgi:hypothetical protein